MSIRLVYAGNVMKWILYKPKKLPLQISETATATYIMCTYTAKKEEAALFATARMLPTIRI